MGALVKILDLGTGRALFEDEDNPGQFDLTRPGEMLGLSDYMSPEQAKDAHNIDIRTDIYTLGCVLYHALAGEPPFADVSPVRQLLRHATETPQPITQRNPEAPPALQQVLDWMMAKDPAKRYATPARAAQALQMFVAANSDFSPRPDASMNAYLEWVDTCDGGQPGPAAPPSRPAAPVKPPPAPVPPARTAAKEVMNPRVPVVNVERVSAPVAASPPPPRSRPQTRRDEDEEERREDRRGGREEDEPPRSRRKAEREEEPEERAGVLGMSPREVLILVLGLGFVGLVGVVVLGFIAFRLLL